MNISALTNSLMWIVYSIFLIFWIFSKIKLLQCVYSCWGFFGRISYIFQKPKTNKGAKACFFTTKINNEKKKRNLFFEKYWIRRVKIKLELFLCQRNWWSNFFHQHKITGIALWKGDGIFNFFFMLTFFSSLVADDFVQVRMLARH